MTLDTLTLPYELIWTDEFAWSDVREARRYTLGGRMVRENVEVLSDKGRPITLESDDGWISRSDLETLYAWAQTKGKTMTLTMHDGRTFNVGFRHWDPPVIEARNLAGLADHASDTWYVVSVKLAVV